MANSIHGQDFKWTAALEKTVVALRNNGLPYSQIAEIVGSTPASVKHKLQRIGQKANENKYAHPVEKIAQLESILPDKSLRVLETHAGYGNLTRFYSSNNHHVVAIEIDKNKTDSIAELKLENTQVIKGDSLKEMLLLEYQNLYFDVVDLDPYGFPSRFVPSSLRLIKNGWLFMTMPKIGVSQMNKITIRHLESFWGIAPKTKPDLIQVVQARMADYGFQNGRSVELVNVIDFGRMFRFAFKIKKTPMTDLVGLQVIRRNNRKGQL